MKIDIYSNTHSRSGYIAVATGSPVPECWAGALLFKTIDLQPGDNRICMGDTAEVLAAIENDGYADLGVCGVA